MNQIIADSIKRCIKVELEESGYKRCTFGFPLRDGRDYCHFLADPECGYHGEETFVDYIPDRSEFWTCRLKEKLG